MQMQQKITPFIVGVFLWISLGLRRPEIFSLAIGTSSMIPVDADQ